MTLLESLVDARSAPYRWAFRVDDLVKTYGARPANAGITLEVGPHSPRRSR